MTNTFKRRIYRLSLLSATSFLLAILVLDLGDTGIVTFQPYLFCYLLMFTGAILGFKALETWSAWDEDTSEDSGEKPRLRNTYPITFYLEAGLMVLLAISLLTFADLRGQPDPEEMGASLLALLLAGFCVLIGHLSSYLE